MTTPTLERIETDIAHLSLPEQLWLIERLAYRIRQHTLTPLHIQQQDLEAMAADPFMQKEIAAIDTEFMTTELDGLDIER